MSSAVPPAASASSASLSFAVACLAVVSVGVVCLAVVSVGVVCLAVVSVGVVSFAVRLVPAWLARHAPALTTQTTGPYAAALPRGPATRPSTPSRRRHRTAASCPPPGEPASTAEAAARHGPGHRRQHLGRPGGVREAARRVGVPSGSGTSASDLMTCGRAELTETSGARRAGGSVGHRSRAGPGSSTRRRSCSSQVLVSRGSV
ncbi:hypothetical protein RKD27_001054 [Streptomyces sp. SAI-126]